MSRIYEALKRAELERNEVGEFQPGSIMAEFPAHETCEPLPNKLFMDLEAVPKHKWEPSLPNLPALGDWGECVEQFRGLRSQLYLLRLEAKLKTIVISSGIPGEGKTFVASNLALTLARNNDRRVLLIDGDLRRPSIHRLLGAPPTPGMAEYLSGNTALINIMQHHHALPNEHHVGRCLSNLTFISAGDCAVDPPEILGNPRFEGLLAALYSHFDWILIDSAPVLAVTDAIDLARPADGVLIVARAAMTPYDVAQRAKAAFVNSRVLGFVLNGAKNTRRGSSCYEYYAKQKSRVDPGQADA